MLSHSVPTRKICRLHRICRLFAIVIMQTVGSQISQTRRELVYIVTMFIQHGERNGAAQHTSHKTPPHPKQIYIFQSSHYMYMRIQSIGIMWLCVCECVLTRANINATFIIKYTPKVYLKTKNQNHNLDIKQNQVTANIFRITSNKFASACIYVCGCSYNVCILSLWVIFKACMYTIQ